MRDDAPSRVRTARQRGARHQCAAQRPRQCASFGHHGSPASGTTTLLRTLSKAQSKATAPASRVYLKFYHHHPGRRQRRSFRGRAGGRVLHRQRPDAPDRKSGLLVRTTNRDLLSTTRLQQPRSRSLPGVVSMEVSFYDGTEWKNAWSIPNTDPTLPQAVRVRLEPADAAPIEVLVPWTTQLLAK